MGIMSGSLNRHEGSGARELVFVREQGFPRRWSAIWRRSQLIVGIITQEHQRNGQGKSAFLYRAAAPSYPELGLFTRLRDAKRALTEALSS